MSPKQVTLPRETKKKYCTNRRATTLESLILYWSYLCEIMTDFDENWSIGIVDNEYDDKSSPTPRLRRRRGQEFTFLSGSSRLPIRHKSTRHIPSDEEFDDDKSSPTKRSSTRGRFLLTKEFDDDRSSPTKRSKSTRLIPRDSKSFSKSRRVYPV